MRNITVSVDEDTYRQSHIRAAEPDTSVSALVRGFLEGLVCDRTDGNGAREPDGETERERRGRLLDDVFDDICATRSGFRAADNISRDALHDRNAVR